MSNQNIVCFGCKWNKFPYCFHESQSYLRLDQLPEGFVCRAKEVEKAAKVEEQSDILKKMDAKLDKLLKNWREYKDV